MPFAVAFSAYDVRAVVPVVVPVAGQLFADFILLALIFVGSLVVIVPARVGAVMVLLRAAVAWALALLVCHCAVGSAPLTGVVSASVPFAIALFVVTAVAASGTVSGVISVTISAPLSVVAAAALALSGAGAGARAGTGTASTGRALFALLVFSVTVSGGLAGVRSVAGITLGCTAGPDRPDGHGAVAPVVHDHVGEPASLTRVVGLGSVFVRCCR